MKNQNRLNLEFFLSEQIPETEMLSASYLFRNGLQRFLTAMIGVLCADAFNRKTHPPGISGRFIQAFTRPSLGGLREFANWLSRRTNGPAVKAISDHMQSELKKGWIKSMIELRNQWAHPKKETPEAILKKAGELTAQKPDFGQFGCFILSNDEGPLWRSSQAELSLSPYFWNDNGIIETFSHLDRNFCLKWQEAESPTSRLFLDSWYKIRQDDHQLAHPTINEIHDRIRKQETSSDGPLPWWLKKVLRSGAIGMLVFPEIIDGIAGHVKDFWPDASVLILTPSPGQSLLECMAQTLGLDRGPSIGEFIKLVDAEHRTVILIKTKDMNTKDLGRILYWLADLNESGLKDDMRVFIGRSQEMLNEDFGTLEERMPGSMDELLRYPPGVEPKILSDCLWSLNQKKSFF